MHITIDNNLQALIPALSDDEYSALETSIINEGCRDALVLWDNTLIDGHNRYAICQQYHIEFKTVQRDFDTIADVKVWMIRNQFARRNLTAYQRSELALQMEDIFQAKAKANLITSTGGINPQPLQNSAKAAIDTRKEIAKIGGVSHDTIARVKKIKAHTDEDTQAKLRRGDVSINKVYKDVVKQEKRDKREQDRQRLMQQADTEFVPDSLDLRHGAFQSVLSDIPDNSVDAIITDPPYPKAYLHLWHDLARFALHKLKPSGFLVAYSGQLYLPQVMTALNEHLEYYWLAGLYHKGIQAQRFERHIQNAMKPILVYYKPPLQKQPQWFVDLVTSPSGDKHHHHWGQSLEPFKYLIERFTSPSDLVVDPFSGGGTTLMACHDLKRRCIASEIDTDAYKLSLARLNEVMTYDTAI